MTRLSAALVTTVLVVAGMTLARAQDGQTSPSADADTNDPLGSGYRDVEQARYQMERARRDLEQAARTIATQAQFVPLQDFSYNFGSNGAFFTSQGRLGLVIVDADNGALVTGVTEGGGAQEAGVRVGDIIQSINGLDLSGADTAAVPELMSALRDTEAGEVVTLVVERAGRTETLQVETAAASEWADSFVRLLPNTVRLSQAPRAPDAPEAPAIWSNGLHVLGNLRTLGFAASPWAEMELVAITEGLGRYFETTEGLLVVRGPDDDAIDIQDGDVILAISGRVPNSPEHAIRILSSFESGETVEFSIMRDGSRQTVDYSIAAVAGGLPGRAPGAVVLPSPD